MLNRKQKRYVRRLAQKRLRAYDPAIVLVPIVSAVMGAMVGVLFGIGIGHLLLFESRVVAGLLGALAGAVAGLIVSRPMVEQRRKYFYRDVITENLEDVNNLE